MYIHLMSGCMLLQLLQVLTPHSYPLPVRRGGGRPSQRTTHSFLVSTTQTLVFSLHPLCIFLLTLGAHVHSEGYCSCPVCMLYVCMYVCMYVCVCVHSYLPPHTLESLKGDTNVFIAIQGSFSILPIFLKMFSSKVMV